MQEDLQHRSHRRLDTDPAKPSHNERPCTEDCFVSTCRRVSPDMTYDPPAREDLPALNEVSAHIYTPIRSWQTRILRTQPGRLGEPLSTHLIVADVVCEEGLVLHHDQVRIDYDALSYHWGYPTPSQLIKCNDADLPVVKSLYLALQRIRHAGQELYLWVDAICINQADPAEKSSQVRRMIDIYRKARQVIAWLGEYGSCWETISRYQSKERPERHTKDCEAYANPQLLPAMTTLLSVPWTTRTWVRQEVWAARHLIVKSGPHAIPFDDLYRLPRRDHLVLDKSKFSFFELDKGNTAQLSTGVNDDLLCVRLKKSAQYEASDPRDYIYGTIGMTDTKTAAKPPTERDSSPVLLIDYARSVPEVFYDATVFIIRNSNNALDVLILAWLSRTRSSRLKPDWHAGLHSWVPDWTNLLRLECHRVEGLLATYVRGLDRLGLPMELSEPGFDLGYSSFSQNNALIIQGLPLFSVEDFSTIRQARAEETWMPNNRLVNRPLLASYGDLPYKHMWLASSDSPSQTLGLEWLLPSCQPEDFAVLCPASRVPLLLRVTKYRSVPVERTCVFVGLCFPNNQLEAPRNPGWRPKEYWNNQSAGRVCTYHVV